MMVHYIWLVGAIPTPMKNDEVKVSWNYDIPQYMESHNPFMFQTTKQLFIGPFR